LYKRSSCAEEIKELLGIFFFAEGPEPAADSSAHYNAIVVFHVLLMFCYFDLDIKRVALGFIVDVFGLG
jgi:hypothetical protein